MASSLDIAFADTVATLHLCAESVRRRPDASMLAKAARVIALNTADLLAEVLAVGPRGTVGDHAVRLGAIFKSAVEADADEDATYLAVDEEGTFREAQRGQTRASVVGDIATGEYEAERVLRLAGPLCEDVTAKVAADVLERLIRTGPGPKPFIPALLAEHMPDEAEALRLSWMTPAERKAERDEINADRAYEAMRDRLMEAAE